MELVFDFLIGNSLQKEYKDYTDNQNKNTAKTICATSRAGKQKA